MTTVSKLKAKDNGRVQVYLDNSTTLELEPDVVAGRGLQVGMEIGEEDLVVLQELGQAERCLDVARRYLAIRSRTENEVSRYLSRKGFSDEVIASTLARLRSWGWVDDQAYAKLWVENRAHFRPRSRYELKGELRSRGIDAEIIEEALQEADEVEAAYQIAKKRLRVLHEEDRSKHLASYLSRRGFNQRVINQALKRLESNKI